MVVVDTFDAARQRIKFHPLNVHFYKIEARQIERIKRDRLNVNHLAVGIIDRLADELCVHSFPEF